MDLLPISGSLAALILGAAIGWFLARSRFTRTIAELNTKAATPSACTLAQAFSASPGTPSATAQTDMRKSRKEVRQERLARL